MKEFTARSSRRSIRDTETNSAHPAATAHPERSRTRQHNYNTLNSSHFNRLQLLGEKKKNVPNASLIPPRITPRVIEEASKQPSCDE